MRRVPSFHKSDCENDIKDDDLYSQPYYFDNLSTEKSVEILKEINKKGAFLIRKRKTCIIQNQPYALSLYYDSIIHHTRINQEPNGYFTLGTNKTQFKSIPDLIRFLDSQKNCQLTLKHVDLVYRYKLNPDLISDNTKIDEDDSILDVLPYVLRHYSIEQIEDLLKNINKDEIFFIRKTNIQHTPYELFVFYKSSVYKLKIKKTISDEYSIELNDKTFDSLPEIVKFFNYNKLKISKDSYIFLKIHSVYIN